MRKMKTLFIREFTKNHEVIIHNEVTPGCEWVLAGEGIATQKVDGEACMVEDDELFVRYDTWEGNKKKCRPMPVGAMPCADSPDAVTGSFPCWVPLASMLLNTTYKPHIKAWETYKGTLPDGTYELCGKHFQGNPDKIEGDNDVFIAHGSIVLEDVTRTFEGIKSYLENHSIEGIVFHRENGEMCKIKKTDFGMEWGHSVYRKSSAKGLHKIKFD